VIVEEKVENLPVIVEEKREKMVLVKLFFLVVFVITSLDGFANHKVFKSSIFLTAATKRNIDTSTVLERKINEEKSPDRVKNIAVKKKEMKKTKRSYKNDKYEIIETELLNYKRIYGNMLVPSNFVIPSNSEWPELSWGFKLGITVCRIRGGKCLTERRKDLTELGFIFESQLKYRYGFVKSLLIRYKQINSHMLVPAIFVIPLDDQNWPQEMWGTKLGFIVHNIVSTFYIFTIHYIYHFLSLTRYLQVNTHP
jgi:hypothetical protein